MQENVLKREILSGDYILTHGLWETVYRSNCMNKSRMCLFYVVIKLWVTNLVVLYMTCHFKCHSLARAVYFYFSAFELVPVEKKTKNYEI